MKVIEFLSSGLFNLNDQSFNVKKICSAMKKTGKAQNSLNALEEIFKLGIFLVNSKYADEPFDVQAELIKRAVLFTWEYFSADAEKRLMKKFPSSPKSLDEKNNVLSLFKNKIDAYLRKTELKKIDPAEKMDLYKKQLKTKYRTIPTFLNKDFPKIKNVHPFDYYFKNGVFSFKQLGIKTENLISNHRRKPVVEQWIKKALIEIYINALDINKVVADTLKLVFPSDDTINDLFIDYWLKQKFQDKSFRKKHFQYLKNILDISLEDIK